SRMKYFENQKRWKECADVAPRAFGQNKDIQCWVMVSWLSCSLKRAEVQEKPEEVLFRPISTLQKSITLLDRGPWRQHLGTLWLRGLAVLIDQNSSLVDSALAWAFLRPELLSPELKNKYFERLQKTKLQASFGSKRTYAPASSDPELEMNQSLETQWLLWIAKKRELQSGNLLAESLVKYLTTYPSGKFQKLWRDRLVDTYNGLWDVKSPETGVFFGQILKLDAVKLADIAQNLHRRANYSDALTLCEEALRQGSSTTSLLWMAGRSSLFVGQYEKAKTYFQTLIERHSGTEEYFEGLFRLGLLHFRLGNPLQAVTYFERLLATGRDKTELNTRYWYVRSLFASNSERATVERDSLIEDYPFSYYGLKLIAEKNENKISFDVKNLPELPKQVTLVGDAVHTWKRAQKLLKAGMWIEAGQEINELPWSRNPILQLAWARWLAKNKQWPPAIRLVNQAFENSPGLKNWDMMKFFFPQDYIGLIKVESERRMIHPRLIQSLIRQESAFGIRAVSTSNAMGLMQMIPPTANDIAKQMKLTLQIPEDMYSPVINIPMGIFYVAQMLEEFKGHVPLALASYNAGPTRIKLWLASRADTKELTSVISTEPRDEIWFDELPWNETSFYVKAILRNVLLYQMREENSLTLKPAFWADLTTKNAKTL
ncbi:MAG: transglycosylase SLT domain-containing protein, partial [Bdellovibrionaceae bacterium]|nr:transglycosylase SLT domain-containing protein [Pseudobdellovibrionaceae bacterium]